jgi:hypothetical protein
VTKPQKNPKSGMMMGSWKIAQANILDEADEAVPYLRFGSSRVRRMTGARTALIATA